jgi:hypothetical protein
VSDIAAGTAVSPHRVVVMGVVNVTDDSFSDGGRYRDPDRAVEHALALIAEGRRKPMCFKPDLCRICIQESDLRLSSINWRANSSLDA